MGSVSLPAGVTNARISYGAAPQQFAELRLPQGKGPFPVIAILHGGCWVSYADASYMERVAAGLTEHGYASWNVEYRRATDPGGGWPNTFEDAEHGVTALRDAAAKYPLDLRRVVVIGHSAGGQLALYVGSRLKWPAISLAGIVDMAAYAKRGPAGCAEGVSEVMGGTQKQHPERYAKVSPVELLPLDIPQILIWGERDNIAPEGLFIQYEKRADHVVEIIRVPGAGHHDFGAAQGPAWDAILKAVAKLMHSGS